MSTTATRYVTLDDTLKLLKAELRREFPATRFSIRRDRGTAYGYVTVSWTDGPSDKQVTAITDMYEGEGFDGMTDSSYAIKQVAADGQGNPIVIRYGTRGIMPTRHISPAFARRLLAQVAAYFGDSNPPAIEEYEGYNGAPAWKMADSNASVGGEYYTTHMHRAASDATRYQREVAE